MAEIKKLNHIAILVEDIEEALRFWRDALGLKLEEMKEVPKEESLVAFLPVGDCEIELIQPTSDDSGVAKYLKKRGPGLHHICIEVTEIQEVINNLLEKGIQLIQKDPILGDDGRKYVFIHPKSAFGVLVELYELPKHEGVHFPNLFTERLVLREFCGEDIPAVFEMYARQDMNQFLPHEPMKTIEEAKTRVKKRINLFKNGWGCRWAIAFKDQPETVIGSCGFFNVRIGTHTVEIGFEVHPDHWRQGIMTEAIIAVLDYSFSGKTPRPINRIEALVLPNNFMSLALLQNLGFIDEGTRRKFGYWNENYHDLKLLALLREEWKS